MNEHSNNSFFTAMVAALLVAQLLAFLFLHFQPAICAIGAPDQQWIEANVDPHIILLNEHDGIEPYVMSFLFFIGGTMAWLLIPLLQRFVLFRNALMVALCALTGYFLYRVGRITFNDLMFLNLLVVLCSATLALLLLWLCHRWQKQALLVVTVCFALLCFLPYSLPAQYDYAYVQAPTWAWLKGGSLRELYFQYDWLVALPTALILKFNFSLHWCRLVLLCGSALLYGALLFAAYKTFRSPVSVALFIATLLLFHYIGNPDLAECPSINALRLDWWLLLFLLCSFRGIGSNALGIALLLLNLLHFNFGLLYSVAYLGMVVSLLLFKIGDRSAMTELLRRVSLNLVLLFVGVVLHAFITGSIMGESIAIYRSIQPGMMPIQPLSLFWFFFFVFILFAARCLQMRSVWSERVLTQNVFLLFLAVASSQYYLGRSHEMNVYHISASLLFCTFTLFDDFLISRAQQLSKFSVVVIGLLIVTVPNALLQSNKVLYNTKLAYTNIQQGVVERPLRARDESVIRSLQKLIHGEKRVYFLTYWANDFYYYYWLDIAPPGNYHPCDAWVLLSERTKFLQKLLNEGYYVVFENSDEISRHRIVSQLRYNYTQQEQQFTAIKLFEK